MRERVFTLAHKLSAMSFGQDRYRRRYWVLPKCGGILVEGLESAEPESADPNAPEIDRKIEDESVDKDQCFKPVTPPNTEENCVKAEPTESSCMSTETNGSAESRVRTDLTVQPRDDPSSEPSVCDQAAVPSEDSKAESCSVVKQERETAAESDDRCSALKAELVSLNCLIGNDVKVNGEVSAIDCKNGFVDLKNCIRSDAASSVMVEPLPTSLPPAAVSDTKQRTLADDSCSMDAQDQQPAADPELISVAANPPESATNDSMQSSLCCKAEDDQPPTTPCKDDTSLTQQQSAVLRLVMSSAGLNSQSYSIASSQRTSQVATPSSEVGGAGPPFDVSAASTPVSFVHQSHASTPVCLSTSFADDLQLSADGELQPDYLAVPQNVRPISLGKLLHHHHQSDEINVV